MIKKIKLNSKLFFETLPKLRKYKPVITRDGLIRLGRKTKGYTMCPLTAYRKELTGVAGNIDNTESYFTNNNFAERIVYAADFGSSKTRTKMIKLLGL